VDAGRVTVTKVPLPTAGGTATPPPTKTGGVKAGGVKTAVGVGVGALVLGGGGYLGVQALGGDDGPTRPAPGTSTPAASASPGPSTAGSGGSGGSDGEVGGTPLDVTFTCDAAAACGTTYDAITRVAGVQISHQGSPAAADAPSDAMLYGVTTWMEQLQISARCPFGTTTGEGTPAADGTFEVHLPLYQFGRCEVTEYRVRDGAKLSDGLPMTLPDATFFDVTSSPVPVDTAALDRLVAGFAADQAASRVDAKVVLDHLLDRDVCFVGLPFADDVLLAPFQRLCADPEALFGLRVDLPPADPADPALSIGAVQVSGLDADALRRLFSDEGPFPCGDGDVGATVCPDSRPPSGAPRVAPMTSPRTEDDLALVVQAVVPEDRQEPVVLDLGGGYQIGVALGGSAPVVEVSGGDEPYVIVRNQVVTIVAPGHTAAAVAVADGVSVAPWPVIPYGADGPSRPATRREAQRFATALAASLADPRDKTFAIEHLDPAVLEVFPTQCPAHVRSIVDPTYAIRVLGLAPPATYAYAPPSAGGASVDVPGAVVVRVRITQDGQTRRAELHFGTSGAGLTWFTDCGAT
jgi:hypothetical protein